MVAFARAAVLFALLFSGCVSSDPETIYTLNKRLSDLEGKRNSTSKTVVETQQSYGLNYVDIYLPLSNGGYYPVRIRQVSANAFKGPKGELYYSFPTVEQLKKLY